MSNSEIDLKLRCKLRERSITLSELARLDEYVSRRFDRYRYLAFRYGNAILVIEGELCTEDDSKCVTVRAGLKRYKQGNVNVILHNLTISDICRRLNIKPNTDLILKIKNIDVKVETLPEVPVIDLYEGKSYRGSLEFNMLELCDKSNRRIELSPGYYIIDIYYSGRTSSQIVRASEGKLIIEDVDIVREIPHVVVIRHRTYSKQCIEIKKLRDITLDELYRYRIMPIRGGYDDDFYLIKC